MAAPPCTGALEGLFLCPPPFDDRKWRSGSRSLTEVHPASSCGPPVSRQAGSIGRPGPGGVVGEVEPGTALLNGATELVGRAVRESVGTVRGACLIGSQHGVRNPASEQPWSR